MASLYKISSYHSVPQLVCIHQLYLDVLRSLDGIANYKSSKYLHNIDLYNIEDTLNSVSLFLECLNFFLTDVINAEESIADVFAE